MNSSLPVERASLGFPPLSEGSLQSDNEQKLSFGDSTADYQQRRRLQPSAESPRVYNFPILPMLESSDEDEEVSLVSSLSHDESLFKRARQSPMNRDKFFDEIIEPQSIMTRKQPPQEIFLPVLHGEIRSTSLPDRSVDAYETPSSPLSSSSCARSLNGQTCARQSSTGRTEAFLSGNKPTASIPTIFRTTLASSSPLSRPELARRTVSFPEATATVFAHQHDRSSRTLQTTPWRQGRSEQSRRQHCNLYCAPPLSSGAIRNNSNDVFASRNGPETPVRRPRHRTVRTAGSLPMDRILVNGSLVTHVQLPNLTCEALSMSSSPEDAKLLGRRPRRLVGRGVSGTVSVGSIVGQSTFVTAPTSSASTGGIDNVESFRRHLKVQRMLNTIVAGPTNRRASRIQRELKCVWNHVSSPIQRWMDKLSPKSAATSGSLSSEVKLKRSAGCLT